MMRGVTFMLRYAVSDRADVTGEATRHYADAHAAKMNAVTQHGGRQRRRIKTRVMEAAARISLQRFTFCRRRHANIYRQPQYTPYRRHVVCLRYVKRSHRVCCIQYQRYCNTHARMQPTARVRRITIATFVVTSIRDVWRRYVRGEAADMMMVYIRVMFTDQPTRYRFADDTRMKC